MQEQSNVQILGRLNKPVDFDIGKCTAWGAPVAGDVQGSTPKFLLLASLLLAIPLAYVYLTFNGLAILTGIAAIFMVVMGIANAVINPNGYDTPPWWTEYRYYVIGWLAFFAVGLYAAANLKYAFLIHSM